MNGLRCSILVEMLYSDQLHQNLRKIVCFFRSGFKLCSFAKRWIQTNKKSLRGFWLTVCCLKNRKNVKWAQKVNGIPPRRGPRQFLMQSFKILYFFACREHVLPVTNFFSVFDILGFWALQRSRFWLPNFAVQLMSKM